MTVSETAELETAGSNAAGSNAATPKAATPKAATPTLVHRTDEQKACRKLIIQHGLRLGQRSGVILIVAAGAVGVGISNHGTPRLLGFVVAALLVLGSLPFMSMGKRLARQDSKVLAAIDDPSLVKAVHIENSPKMRDRFAIAIRHADDTADHILLAQADFQMLLNYFRVTRPDLVITQSENAARTIRLAVS